MLAIKYGIHWNKIKGFKLPFKDPKNSAKFIFQKTSFLAPDFFLSKMRIWYFCQKFSLPKCFSSFLPPAVWPMVVLSLFLRKRNTDMVSLTDNRSVAKSHPITKPSFLLCSKHTVSLSLKTRTQSRTKFLPISFKATTVSSFFVLNESLKS